jgi:energy-coupling factor transport system ATP-binding protein
MIKFNDVSLTYKVLEHEVSALKGINIQIEQGEYVAVIGHNGSGKSTMAKLINGILMPTEGNVKVYGMDTSDEKDIWNIRSSAGMVFQNPDNQIVATVVEEDVAFGPENLGIESSKIYERVEEALKMVHMEHNRKKPPHLLSGGQKQRVAIAGILAMRPRTIILDEPTSMLDPIGRKEVIETIERLNSEENITIINITHFMDEAIRAKRVIVMDKGRVIMDGTPHEVFKDVKKLQDLGLDVPQVTLLSDMLRKNGIELGNKILNIEEMVDALCQYL